MSFSDWSIGRKLAAVLTCILALFVGSSALSIYQSMQQDKILKHMITEVLVTERALERWNKNVTAGVQRAAAIAKSTDPSLVAYFEKATQEATADSAVQMKIINANLKTPEQKALMEKTSKLRDEYLQLRKDIAKLKNEGDVAGADQLFTQRFEPTMKAYLGAMDAMTAHEQATFDRLTNESKNGRYESMWHLALFTATALALGIVLSVMVTRRITVPLHKAQKAARDVAALDLSVTTHTLYTQD